MNDYLTITDPRTSTTTVYSFVEPPESGTVSAGTVDLALDHCTPYSRGGMPELDFTRILGALTTLPDPWSAGPCVWSHGTSHSSATAYFSGSVVGYQDRYDHDLGWIRQYRALGLRNLGDYVPVTDANTYSDNAQFNMPANSINSIPSRMGRTVGQAALEILSMPQNAAALSIFGIGNYTSTGSGGSATAVMVNALFGYGTVSGLTLVEAGSGYTVAPTVVVAGPCTTQATFTATVSVGGAITGFTAVAPGYGGAGYTSPPAVIISTLPAITITDLEALTVIPPFQMTFCGEKILASVESIVRTCHPNHWLYVDPTGNIRLLDQRACANNTVTLNGSDPRWLMPDLHRDLSDSYSQLLVRGDISVTGVWLGTAPTAATGTVVYNGPLTSGATNTGGLIEDFAWGPYTTNAAAKAAYSISSFKQLTLGTGQDLGSCVCDSTTEVTITSNNTALTLAADQLDQTDTGLHAIITVSEIIASSGLASVSANFSTQVIANTAMSAGGSSTLTLAQPMPVTTYNSYFLTFLNGAGNVVYRRYLVVNHEVGAALQNAFPFPFAFSTAAYMGTGPNVYNAAALTSAPMGIALYPSAGVPSGEGALANDIICDPTSGTILFNQPTAFDNGFGLITPSSVFVFVPVATGALQEWYPSSTTYGGTLYTVEGIQRTKTITLRDWTQESSTNYNLATFAYEQFTSICDIVIEGTFSYLGLATNYLAPGQAISIAGNGYTTGYESAAIPVASTEVIFQPGNEGTSYLTICHLSNRRQRYTGAVYVRPPVTTGFFYGSEATLKATTQAAAANQAIAQNTFGAPSDLSNFVTGSAADLAGQVRGVSQDLAGFRAGMTQDAVGISQGMTQLAAGMSEPAPMSGNPEDWGIGGPGQNAGRRNAITIAEVERQIQQDRARERKDREAGDREFYGPGRDAWADQPRGETEASKAAEAERRARATAHEPRSITRYNDQAPEEESSE
ncbi:MAG TPA: hypothetical protein VKF17_16880 [Isosphaeraceae bacterium]|nr:hypothetical protein [Isosphaeraceae bacterium]